jgi:cation:H+ antiporter
MEAWLEGIYAGLHGAWLAFIIAGALFLLVKAADLLVDKAVEISERSNVPKAIIGATVVSLGTTTPEAAVSVLAALQGEPALALGNAVGSVICDTGLILGLAAIISPLRLDRRIVNRQGWIQLGAGLLLILGSAPWSNLASAHVDGGGLPQWVGLVFLVLLVVYMIQSIRWARRGLVPEIPELEELHGSLEPLRMSWLKLVAAIAAVVASAQILIPAVSESAVRLQVPQSVIAATLVAFGTSLPEMVTAITAARRGHGELAIGNVIGADILNVLFVAGSAAAVTPGGLEAGPYFFRVLFPVMMFVLVVFRLGVMFSTDFLKRPVGVVLVAAYLVYLLTSYVWPDAAPTP